MFKFSFLTKIERRIIASFFSQMILLTFGTIWKMYLLNYSLFNLWIYLLIILLCYLLIYFLFIYCLFYYSLIYLQIDLLIHILVYFFKVHRLFIVSQIEGNHESIDEELYTKWSTNAG